MAGDLQKSLGEWLVDSGAALELRIARAMQLAHLPVDAGFTYLDPVENKEREGDISSLIELGSGPDSFKLLIVVECKESPNAIWVGIKQVRHRSKGSRDVRNWTSAGSLDPDASAAALRYLWDRDVVESSQPCARVTQAFKTNDPAYNAVRQVTASTLGRLRQVSTTAGDNYGNTTDDTVALAVVVMTGQLFTAELDRSSELTVTEVDRLEVLTPSPDGEGRPVLIMTETAFADFSAALNPRRDDW